MPFTPDPRDFYPPVLRTKLLLMPSLWLESFGLIAAEAMLNGVPVLASNRGALPETIGDAGFLFDVPDRYTFQTRELPTADDVAPWIETILRLWDDPVEYDRCSQRRSPAGPSVASRPTRAVVPRFLRQRRRPIPIGVTDHVVVPKFSTRK